MRFIVSRKKSNVRIDRLTKRSYTVYELVAWQTEAFSELQTSRHVSTLVTQSAQRLHLRTVETENLAPQPSLHSENTEVEAKLSLHPWDIHGSNASSHSMSGIPVELKQFRYLFLDGGC